MEVSVPHCEGVLQCPPHPAVMATRGASGCGLPADAGGHDLQWLAISGGVFWCWHRVLHLWEMQEVSQ